LDQAREHRPDVVLLDVMMPGLDGWQVAERLLEDERTSGIPIILLTARAEFRDRARGLASGSGRRPSRPLGPRRARPSRPGRASHSAMIVPAWPYCPAPQARFSPAIRPRTWNEAIRVGKAPWAK